MYIYYVCSWAFNLDENGKREICKKEQASILLFVKSINMLMGNLYSILIFYVHSFTLRFRTDFFLIPRRAVSIDFRHFIFFLLLDMRFLCCMHNAVHSSDIAKLSTMWRSHTNTRAISFRSYFIECRIFICVLEFSIHTFTKSKAILNEYKLHWNILFAARYFAHTHSICFWNQAKNEASLKGIAMLARMHNDFYGSRRRYSVGVCELTEYGKILRS